MGPESTEVAKGSRLGVFGEKRMARPEPTETAQIAAMGVAAMAFATEMLLHFERKGLVSHDEGASIIEAALAGVESLDADRPHRSFQMARTLLDGQLVAWRRQRPK